MNTRHFLEVVILRLLLTLLLDKTNKKGIILTVLKNTCSYTSL